MTTQDVSPSTDGARRRPLRGLFSAHGPCRRDCCWVNGAAAECCCDADGRTNGLGMAVADAFGLRHQLASAIAFAVILGIGTALLIR